MSIDFLNTLNKGQLEGAERTELVEKCQHNDWLKYNGYAWQDDSFLEEYPFEFVRVERIDDLRTFFNLGNWSIRQGVLYKDLAFIQQVNGGDEWWTLKKTDEGWLDFESMSFENMAKDPKRFNHTICSMVASSAESCEKLDYLAPQDFTDRLVAIAEEFGYWDINGKHPSLTDLRISIIHSLEHTPEDVRDWLQSIGEKNNSVEALKLAKHMSTLSFKGGKQRPHSDKTLSGRRSALQEKTSSPAAAKDNAIRVSTQQSNSNRSVQKAR